MTRREESRSDVVFKKPIPIAMAKSELLCFRVCGGGVETNGGELVTGGSTPGSCGVAFVLKAIDVVR